ncbi:MAG: DUF86 domain-containing protein [Nanoarchaeota archaeon]
MKKESLIFVKHILEAITDTEESTKNLSKKEFKENKDIKDATIRRLEIIGEAVKNIPDSFKDKYPKILWKDIAGMRDKLMHHYFGVDLEIVWKVIKEDLPDLKNKIEKIIKEN